MPSLSSPSRLSTITQIIGLPIFGPCSRTPATAYCWRTAWTSATTAPSVHETTILAPPSAQSLFRHHRVLISRCCQYDRSQANGYEVCSYLRRAQRMGGAASSGARHVLLDARRRREMTELHTAMRATCYTHE